MKDYLKKILDLNKLKKKILVEKIKKKKIVHCHGVFDVIHIGHIKHLNSAKKSGDFLVVSITSDKFVNKGPGRPKFNQNLRAEVIASIEYVDAVIINEDRLPVKLIDEIKPDIYFKGPDYIKQVKDKSKDINKDILAVKKNGGKIIFSKDITFSSSNLINNYFDQYNKEQKKFIDNIKRKYSFEEIFKNISKFSNQKIVLLGETIIDQYIFGDVLGKAGKEPHLVFNEKKNDIYLGGAAAIANHLSSFCKSVFFFTLANLIKKDKKYIKISLKKNIKLRLCLDNNFKTIIKKRFVDELSNNKLYGSYAFDINYRLPGKIEDELVKKINEISKKTNHILISDYGHGFITNKILLKLQKFKKFISVNAQMNASNQSFYSLEKYRNIDCLLINQNELRSSMKDKSSSIENISLKLLKKLKIKKLIITRGSEGSMLLEKNKKIIYAPAFAKHVVDKVGAGDTMLAIIALSMRNKIPSDLALFLGSIAAATTVESIGNSKFMDKVQFLRQIEFMLK